MNAGALGDRADEDLYVALLHKGTDVWRPTRGRRVGPTTYEVLPTDGYDPEDEAWEFLPGMVVEARLQRLSSGVRLVAWKRAPTTSEDASTRASDRMAARAGIDVVSCGGMRLVAYADAMAFLDACAAAGIGVHATAGFRLDEGTPVEVFLPLDEEARARAMEIQPRALSRAESVARARRYIERHLDADVWFDFTLEEYGRWDVGDWRLVSCHVAPLPPVDSRVRISSESQAEALEQDLEEAGREGFVWLAEIEASPEQLDPRRILRDLAALALGDDLPPYVRVMPLERLWLPLSRGDAMQFLVHAIGHDFAYGDQVVDVVVARRIAEQFLGLFSADADFFTSFSLGEDGCPQAGTPLIEEATYEAGVAVTDGMRAGLLLVTGED
jgi:hypothetical protein